MCGATCGASSDNGNDVTLSRADSRRIVEVWLSNPSFRPPPPLFKHPHPSKALGQANGLVCFSSRLTPPRWRLHRVKVFAGNNTLKYDMLAWLPTFYRLTTYMQIIAALRHALCENLDLVQCESCKHVQQPG